MECTQAEAFEQYIRDLRVVRSISRPSFPEGKAPAAVLEEIQTNALRCNALMRQNEALLAQFVYDRDPASLTETDIQGLSAFAGRLFNYANSEDMGVAFKVHQLLLAAASHIGRLQVGAVDGFQPARIKPLAQHFAGFWINHLPLAPPALGFQRGLQLILEVS
jgi:hypothetical protein